MKVLIIDDDADIRTIAAITLRRLGGMEVIDSASGIEGARQAQDAQPDVILLDMMMPGLNGLETLAALRSQANTVATPVIFLTAKAVGADLAQMDALGAIGVLVKPFNPRTLAADIRALIIQPITP